MELHLPKLLSVFTFFPAVSSYFWQVIVSIFLRSDVALGTVNWTEFTDTLERMLLSVSNKLLRLIHSLSAGGRREELDWCDRCIKSFFKVTSINLRPGDVPNFLKDFWVGA
jgi:hypothetical protein